MILKGSRLASQTTTPQAQFPHSLYNPRTASVWYAQPHMVSQYGQPRFLTDSFTLPALTIAAICKSLWQVELIYRWINQQVSIKALDGTNESAVKTQI